MPNDMLAANAASLPTRRHALISLAAFGALLVAPAAAKSASADDEIFAQVARVRAAHNKLLAIAAAEYADEQTEEEAFDDALDGLSGEQETLLGMQPRSPGALKAIAGVLLETDALGADAIAMAFAHAIVATPDAGRCA